MTHPISGMSPRPPDRGSPPATAGEQPLSTQQRTVLERLITRLISLTSQQNAEVWASVRHDLHLKGDAPLLSRHFPAAEQNLNQRLDNAQHNLSHRQTLARLAILLNQGNNRQAVSDFIRQRYGQTALNQLTPDQLTKVLQLLENGELTIPQPQLRPATDRPLLPAEHNTLNQLVIKVVAATGETHRAIWQSMLDLCGIKAGEPIPAKYFVHLVTWLQARQALSAHAAPTLQTVQAALKQPLEEHEWPLIRDYARQNWQAEPQSALTSAQLLELLNLLVRARIRRAHGAPSPQAIHGDAQPIGSPFTPVIERLRPLTARPGLLLLLLAIVLMVLWLAL